MNAILLVFVGAGAGGVLRHLTNVACLRWCGPQFPWGTLAVNVVGSLAMGVLAGWLAVRTGPWTGHMKLLLLTGVLGGFTTFSAFSLDAVALWERGATLEAALYVGASVALSIIALVIGLMLARAFL